MSYLLLPSSIIVLLLAVACSFKERVVGFTRTKSNSGSVWLISLTHLVQSTRGWQQLVHKCPRVGLAPNSPICTRSDAQLLTHVWQYSLTVPGCACRSKSVGNKKLFRKCCEVALPLTSNKASFQLRIFLVLHGAIQESLKWAGEEHILGASSQPATDGKPSRFSSNCRLEAWKTTTRRLPSLQRDIHQPHKIPFCMKAPVRFEVAVARVKLRKKHLVFRRVRCVQNCSCRAVGERLNHAPGRTRNRTDLVGPASLTNKYLLGAGPGETLGARSDSSLTDPLDPSLVLHEAVSVGLIASQAARHHGLPE